MDTIRDTETARPTEPDPGLSGHESRCLCRRIGECEEAMQLAILGAGQACEKTHEAPALLRIRAALEAAERQLGLAAQLARQTQATAGEGAR